MFYLLSAISLAFGVLFLFFPEALIKLSEWGNRLVFTDHNAVAHRKVVGSMLLVVSVFMLLVAWTY